MTLLAALAAGWVALVLAAPWLPTPAASVVYLFGARICHQLAERSWHLDGAQLPVCARCLGIYAGAALTFVYVRGASLVRLAPRTRQGSRHKMALIAALALNVLTLWSPSNSDRTAAGLALGIALAWAIGTVDYERWPSARRITSAPPHSRI